MRAVLLSAALVVAGTFAQAETVRVLSGEHEDFSRIVLLFDRQTGWKQSATPDGFEVEFDRKGISLDLSRVFEKIPRDRIDSVEFRANDGILELDVPCDCILEIFDAGRNSVALDVKSKEPDETLAASPESSQKSVAFPLGAPAPSARVELAANQFLENIFGKHQAEPVDGNNSTAVALRVRGMERALLEQLGRAATQGVARIDKGAKPLTEDIDPDRNYGIDGNRHLRMHTVFDMAPLLSAGTSGRLGEDVICYGEDVLDISTWLANDDPSKAIALARVALTSEFDSPDSYQVENLVRTYLALGFGAEARAVLSEYDVQIEYHDLYRAMASIVDGDAPEKEFGSNGQTDCDGPTALWAYAAHDERSAPKATNLKSVQAWFLRLPPALRAQLGPRLVENLLAGGHLSEARTIRNAISRATPEASTALKLIDAQSAMESGMMDVAAAKFSEVSVESEDQAPEAMTKLLRGMRLGGGPSADSILDAEALAFEHHGTEIGIALLEEIVLSWAAMGDFDAGWRVWKDLESQDFERPAPDPILSEMILEMLRHGRDGKLLRILHSGEYEDLTDMLSRETLLALSEWLLGSEALNLAQELAGSFESDNDLAVRKLRARIALKSDQPTLALSHVAAEEDPESVSLRAEAMARMGNHAAAAELFSRAGREDDAAREAWLDGGDEAASTVGHPEDSAFLRDAGTPAETPGGTMAGAASQAGGILAEHSPDRGADSTVADPESGPFGTVGSSIETPAVLQEGRDLIEASRRSREAIFDLLNAGNPERAAIQ